MTGPWRILYADTVVRDDIPALGSAKARIKTAIETKLMRDPLTFGKPLRYSLSGQRSLRVGDWRILYQIDHPGHTVRITAIGHRSRIYEE